MESLVQTCKHSLQHDFVGDKLVGFSPKKSHFNRLHRESEPQLFVKCLICDSTNDTVDVRPLRSKFIHTYPVEFVFLPFDCVEFKVGDPVLIQSESFCHEYYLANLLEYNKQFKNWKCLSSGLGEFWIMEKNIIMFHKFSTLKKTSCLYCE